MSWEVTSCVSPTGPVSARSPGRFGPSALCAGWIGSARVTRNPHTVAGQGQGWAPGAMGMLEAGNFEGSGLEFFGAGVQIKRSVRVLAARRCRCVGPVIQDGSAGGKHEGQHFDAEAQPGQ